MIIRIGNNIEIEGAPYQVKQKIKKALTLPNPLYYKLLRLGNRKALYKTKKNFRYYWERGDKLIIGRGNYDRLQEFLEKIDTPYEFQDVTVAPSLPPQIRLEGLELREYQKGVPEQVMEHTNGIMELGTAFGKTLISLYLIEKLRTTTLIVVPRRSILQNFIKEIRKYYGYEPGVIQGGKFQVGEITVASIATLKKRDLSALENKFGMVIFDECHTAISDQSVLLLSCFNCRYLYGMSATPERAEDDGRTEALEFTFGRTLVNIEMPQTSPVVELAFTNIPIQVSYNYAWMIEQQIENEERNRMIADKIAQEIDEGRRVLVLTKRVDHYKYIYDRLQAKGYTDCYCIKSSGKAQEMREQNDFLARLKQGETGFSVILGTFSMLSTGVDIPALDTLVLAGDIKESLLVKQSAGRIMRLFEEKEDPKIIDFVDNKNGMLFTQFRKRKRFYKRNGWEFRSWIPGGSVQKKSG